MKRWLPVAVAVVLTAALAVGGSIKVWTDGDWVLSSDLNANFAHIHSTMVGGHGARLVNSDVNANAAIAHTKLATPGLVPKATFIVGNSISSPCTVVGACALQEATGLSATVSKVSTGNYQVTLAAARPNALYQVIPTAIACTPAAAGAPCYCTASSVGITTTTSFVNCSDLTGVAAGSAPVKVDAVFSVVIMDKDN